MHDHKAQTPSQTSVVLCVVNSAVLGRSNPIVRAAQITLEHTPRMNMSDKPNLVAVFYQNAGHIYRSEKDYVRASRCLRVAARTLRQACDDSHPDFT